MAGAARRMAWPARRATARWRSLPDFLIIGTQKGGTTSLFHYLAQHPRIRTGPVKEVHYFDGGTDPDVDTFARGSPWYRAHFPLRASLSDGRLTGEASPLYLFNPEAPDRIRRLVPDAKLIVLLRNPADRAISHYFHQRTRKREKLTLEAALRAEDARIGPAIARGDYKDPAFIHFSYKTRGHYATQLARYLARFPPHQILVMRSEELFAAPRTALARACDFLGIDDHCDSIDVAPRNTARSQAPVDGETYRALSEYFVKRNEILYDMIAADLGW